MSFLDTHERADFGGEMSVSADGSGSVGWCGVSKTQPPPVHTPVLPQLMPGAACHRAVALPHTRPALLVAGPLTVLRCCLTDTISSKHDTTEQASEIPL